MPYVRGLRRLRQYLPTFATILEEDPLEPRIVDVSQMRIGGFQTGLSRLNDGITEDPGDGKGDVEDDWVVVTGDKGGLSEGWQVISENEWMGEGYGEVVKMERSLHVKDEDDMEGEDSEACEEIIDGESLSLSFASLLSAGSGSELRMILIC